MSLPLATALSQVQDITQVSGDGEVQNQKQRTLGGFVYAYNSQNPTAPFRFKSGADYLANKKALILNQNGSATAPTLVSATAGNQSIALVWTAPRSTGGSAITDYKYTTDNTTYRSLATTGTSATITLNSSGIALVNGTSYTVTIVAVNAVGPSAVSNSVSATPTAPSSAMSLTISISNNTLSYRTITPQLFFLTGQSVTINWGDGSTGTYNSLPTHVYATTGTYILAITGTANRFSGINSGSGKGAIVSVSSFLDSLTDLSNCFNTQPNNFTIPATLPPNVTNLTGMFSGATAFNQNIGAWNTATVRLMSSMFSAATAFNQNIGAWNTGAVTSMSGMFNNATAFNQNIGAWNTGAVTNMSSMFQLATAFNQNIGAWNTAAVTNMNAMFRSATSFNQSLNSWNTTAVTTMSSMFYSATAFNGNITSWSTDIVSNMNSMFNGATVFNQNIGAWGTFNVIDMISMFNGATAFNQNIGAWNTGAVTNMSSMFSGATAFNQNIGAWNTGAVTSMSGMFNGATAFNQDIHSWDITSLSTAEHIFKNAAIASTTAYWPNFASSVNGLPDPTTNPTYYTA